VQEVLLEENATIDSALISHWHGDHVGGIKQLLEAYPAVKVHKHQPEDGQLNISDGDIFSVDGATLRAVHTPGHTQDHISLVLEEEEAMFTGDNVLGHGTAVFEDLASYINSLRKMRNLFTGRAYPGHGAVINDGKAKILEYIRHRQQREEQVLQVLRSSHPSANKQASARQPGDWTSMEIVKVIYKDVPEDLHLPAHGGIMQVLLKLKEEDKVSEDPITGNWAIREKATL
jgi:ribonuclease/clavin/mitogillin